MVFGVPESQSIVQAKSAIDEILQFVVGRAVPVVDAFRLGKPKRDQGRATSDGDSESRPRPILVKLGCVWDRRVVLLAKRKLKEFESGSFFIRADMSITEREKLRKRWDEKRSRVEGQLTSQ